MGRKTKAAQIVGNAKRYIRSSESYEQMVVAFKYCQLGLRWLKKNKMVDEYLEVITAMDRWWCASDWVIARGIEMSSTN